MIVMMNLLPIDKREEIEKDYYRRLVVVSLFSLSIVFSIFLIVIFSFYLSLRISLQAERNLKEDEERLLSEKTLKEISELEELILIGQESKGYPSLSSVLNLLLNDLPEGIEYSDIDYKYNDEEREAQISLSGFASSRQIFTELLGSLRDDKLISEIVSPPSNLIHDQDVSFNLQLILDFKNI